MAARVGALFVGLGLDDAQYRVGMAGAVGTAQKSTARMQMNFSTLNFRTFLYGMAGIYAVQAAIKGIMSPAINFESQLAQVSTMLDKSAMSVMPVYKEGLQSMAKEFGQSTETLSKGLYDILSATIEPAKAIGVLEEANKAATAGITDTGTATTGIVTILKAYQLDASKAADVSDLLFATVKRGRTVFAELAPAIGVVASSAAMAGLKVEEMAAMLAVMTRAGLSTDMAVIALANMLNSFIKPTGPAIDAAKELGLELSTATLRTMGMTGVMKVLSGATETQTAAIFGNIRGLRGINAAMSDTAGFAKDMEIMFNRSGLTMEAFNKQYNTTAMVLKRFGQTLLVDVVHPITDAFLPAILTAATKMTEWTVANKEFIKVKVPEYIRGLTGAISDFVAVVGVLKTPLIVLFQSVIGIIAIAALASLGVVLTKLGTILMAVTPTLTAFQFALNLGVGTVFVASLITIYQTLKSFSSVLKENKKDFVDWRFGMESLTTNLESRFSGDRFFFATDVAITKGYKERRAALDALVKTEAEQKKPLEQVYGILDGINTLSEYGLTLEMTKLRMLRTYTEFLKEQKPERGTFDYGFTKEQMKAADAKLKFQAERGMRWYKADQDRIDAQTKLEQDAADETIHIARDTEIMKLEFTKTGTNLQIAQEELRLKYYKEDLQKRFGALYYTLKMGETAEQQSADIVKLIRENATNGAIEQSAQAWEAFKDHFSSILARMLNESNLSAQAIGDAFLKMFKRLALERIAQDTIDTMFDFLAPKGGSLRNFLAPNKVPGGETSELDKWLGRIGTIASFATLFLGTGGMVYKPSLALVGESGPERVLNPAETRAYNSNSTDDHSNVVIHIHADSETLRGLNPWKFAELYKEAKRSQLLAG